jgi:hypothetical protein
MSMNQVIAIVGREPGDYTSGGYFPYPDGSKYWQHQYWTFDDGELLVWFDDEGKAADVMVRNVLAFGRPPTLFERICRLMGI